MAATRKAREKEQDKQLIAPLYFKAYTFREIAESVSAITGRTISHVTVFNDVKEILKESEEARKDFVNNQLTIELGKINKLEREYWEAWEKSKTDQKKKSVEKKDDCEGDPAKGKKKSSTRVLGEEIINMGDPRYLAGIERCIEMRCKLLGINGTQKVDVTTGGNKIQFTGFNFLPVTPNVEKLIKQADE
jgi:hypothetical protein|nr:MAG TPA: hypothetical protein [Caudoviricetes sp.]